MKWFKDGIEIRKGKKYDIISKGAERILVISKCLFDDEAEYACEAKTARTSGLLTVIGKCIIFIISSVKKKKCCFDVRSYLVFQILFCRGRSCFHKTSS